MIIFPVPQDPKTMNPVRNIASVFRATAQKTCRAIGQAAISLSNSLDDPAPPNGPPDGQPAVGVPPAVPPVGPPVGVPPPMPVAIAPPGPNAPAGAHGFAAGLPVAGGGHPMVAFQGINAGVAMDANNGAEHQLTAAMAFKAQRDAQVEARAAAHQAGPTDRARCGNRLRRVFLHRNLKPTVGQPFNVLFLGIPMRVQYHQRGVIATHAVDPMIRVGGHRFETYAMAKYWIACVVIGRRRNGMSLAVAREWANLETKNMVCRQYNLVGGDFAMP